MLAHQWNNSSEFCVAGIKVYLIWMSRAWKQTGNTFLYFLHIYIYAGKTHYGPSRMPVYQPVRSRQPLNRFRSSLIGWLLQPGTPKFQFIPKYTPTVFIAMGSPVWFLLLPFCFSPTALLPRDQKLCFLFLLIFCKFTQIRIKKYFEPSSSSVDLSSYLILFQNSSSHLVSMSLILSFQCLRVWFLPLPSLFLFITTFLLAAKTYDAHRLPESTTTYLIQIRSTINGLM